MRKTTKIQQKMFYEKNKPTKHNFQYNKQALGNRQAGERGEEEAKKGKL